MSNCCFGAARILTALLVVMWLPVGAAGQTAGYTPHRTADGHPDLQGIWGHNSITPLERPDSLADRTTLTDEELARVEATANALFAQDSDDAGFGDQIFTTAISEPDSFTSSDGATGNYNQFWLVERDFDHRTSLIIDPPNGKLPPTTSAAKMAATVSRAGRGRPAEWTENRGLSERCITFGLPNLLSGYNSYYQIFQTTDHVVIAQELIHTTRIIPLDDRPHVHDDIRQWHGDSRARWEDDTLVVETKHFSQQSNFRNSHEHLQLVERFTRVGPDELHYEFTVTDPTTWTQPWTALVTWKLTDEPMFEYACHEGNLGMAGILSGARADEINAPDSP